LEVFAWVVLFSFAFGGFDEDRRWIERSLAGFFALGLNGLPPGAVLSGGLRRPKAA
jgi:hypothetical protein